MPITLLIPRMNRIILSTLCLVLLTVACQIEVYATQPATNSIELPVNVHITPEVQTPTLIHAPEPTPQTGTVLAETLNVRSCAGTGCTVVDVLEYGQQVRLYELVTVDSVDCADWYRVVYVKDGNTGAGWCCQGGELMEYITGVN